jgi:hypothetical protein
MVIFKMQGREMRPSKLSGKFKGYIYPGSRAIGNIRPDC